MTNDKTTASVTAFDIIARANRYHRVALVAALQARIAEDKAYMAGKSGQTRAAVYASLTAAETALFCVKKHRVADLVDNLGATVIALNIAARLLNVSREEQVAAVGRTWTQTGERV